LTGHAGAQQAYGIMEDSTGSDALSSRTEAPLEARVRAAYGRIPRSERKIADLILEAPGTVTSHSATELAALAGTSKAAASRFFKRLGFASFGEARRLARAQQQWGSPLYLDRPTTGAHEAQDELAAYLADEQAILSQSFAGLDGAQMAEIAEAIRRARRLWLLGFRNSHYLAAYARWQFVQLRSEVHLIPRSEETLAEQLVDIGAEDLVIAVGIRRRVAGFRRLLEACAGRGAKLLYVTDPSAREEAAPATWTLVCQVESGYLFDSYLAPLSQLRYLAIKAYGRAGRRGRDRLAEIERLHDELDEFA
jgi:DNA-binding MurR/RpiR family transcriptional regulator